MKQSIVKIASAVWLVGLVLSGFLLSIPPDRVPVFLGLACIAIVPMVLGSRRFQIFGIAAVASSVMLAYWEHEAGLREKAQWQRMRQMILQRNAETNAPATNTKGAPHE